MDIKLKLSHNLCFKFCLWYFVLIFGKEWPLNNESAIVLSLPENTNSYMCLPALSRTLSFYTRIWPKPPTRIVELHTISPTTPPALPSLSTQFQTRTASFSTLQNMKQIFWLYLIKNALFGEKIMFFNIIILYISFQIG